MKTAEKLFSRYWDSGKVGEILCMSKPNFIKALAEHDAEIISKIKEMIKNRIRTNNSGAGECKKCGHERDFYTSKNECKCQSIEALTELLNILE